MPVKVYDGANWVTVAGDGAAGAPGTNGTNGKIIQVVSTNKLDTFTSNSTSPVDVTGLSVTLTPTLATSKVLIFAMISGALGCTVLSYAYTCLPPGRIRYL